MTMKVKLFGTPTLLTQYCQSIILITWNFNWSTINGNNQILGWERGKKKKNEEMQRNKKLFILSDLGLTGDCINCGAGGGQK